MHRSIILSLAIVFLTGCSNLSRETAPRPRWAVAIHGGAGTLDRNAPAEEQQAYRAALDETLRDACARLERGEAALDVAEAVVRRLEDDPKFNAGRGAAYTADGAHELDACIMDGRALRCGAVAGVRTVKNPISLARRVMEKTNRVLLVGPGADQFAEREGVERVENSYFDTPKRYQMLQEHLEKQKSSSTLPPGSAAAAYGTVGCVVLDQNGNLAAATSTGGLTGKQFGRVGDCPIVGAGTYANNATCAVSCTGTGEEFIRHTAARDIAALMEYRGLSLNDAAREVVFKKLTKGDGGIIAVSHGGEIALVYNSQGMYRAAADANGSFQVAIWER